MPTFNESAQRATETGRSVFDQQAIDTALKDPKKLAQRGQDLLAKARDLEIEAENARLRAEAAAENQIHLERLRTLLRDAESRFSELKAWAEGLPQRRALWEAEWSVRFAGDYPGGTGVAVLNWDANYSQFMRAECIARNLPACEARILGDFQQRIAALEAELGLSPAPAPEAPAAAPGNADNSQPAN